jgi:uncharacterized membrane protein
MFLIAETIAVDANVCLAFFAIPAFRTRTQSVAARLVKRIKLRIRISRDPERNLREHAPE